MKEFSTFSAVRRLFSSFLERESTFLGKQQLYVLAFSTAITVVALSANLFGISGPTEVYNWWLNLVYLVLTMICCIAYLCRIVPLAATLFAMVVIAEAFTSIEMILCALSPTPYHLMLIVANMTLLAVFLLIAMIAYLRYTPYILSLVSMGTYLTCVVLTGSEILANFFGVFLAIFILTSILGARMVKNTQMLERKRTQLEQENTSLKQEEAEFYNQLGLRKEQVAAFVDLTFKKVDSKRTGKLLDALGDDLRRNVIANVKEHLAVEETGLLEMESIFPELTASEREVSRLILQGKKLSDICILLDKKESNINSTRVHIRKKLNLAPSDNLLKVLQERVEERKG